MDVGAKELGHLWWTGSLFSALSFRIRHVLDEMGRVRLVAISFRLRDKTTRRLDPGGAIWMRQVVRHCRGNTIAV
jgi:hypothetical protein